jgi:subtilase family serine protease
MRRSPASHPPLRPRWPAGRSVLPLVIGLLVGSFGVATAGGATARAAILVTSSNGPRMTRIGAAPRVPAGATALGAVAATAPVQATIALTPHDPAALAAYAQAVATPGSADYHRYLSVTQFAGRFGATPDEVAAVQAALRAQGLAPSAPTANRLELSVTAPAGLAAGAFATSLERFRLADGARAVASLTAPAVPAAIAGFVQGVVGLSSLITPTPAALIRRPARRRPIRLARQDRLARFASGPALAAAGAPGEAAACGAAAGSGAYTAGQIASAYGFPGLYSTGDGGGGQTIALFELEPYAATDIAAYQHCYGTSASVTPISVDGGAGSGSGSGEAALDIEDLIGLAPRASILVYEGPNTGAGAYDTYARIISDDRAAVISTSWGACEDPGYLSSLQAEASLFEEAAAQGQTVLAASGDSGADDCQTGAGAAVDDPASQPDVTGVGGTTMRLGAGGAASETVWNSTWAGGAGAGGGGVSSIWPRPSYQTGSALAQSATTCGSGQTACREVPDVSADADVNTGYAIYYQGGWYDFGGTSAAAPTWAALVALTNAWSGCSAPVGFLNPGLYRAAQSASGTLFDDVIAGNNSFDGVTGYSAAPGYDMASGWGSPRGSALAGALCGASAPAAAPPGATAAPAGGSGTTGTTGPTTTGTGSPGTTGTGTTGTGTTGTGTPGGTTSTGPTGTVTTPGTPANPIATTTSTTSSSPVTAPTPGTSPTVAVAVAPTVTGSVGRRLTIRPRAVDTASLSISWRAENLPAGLSVDPSSGVVSGRPLRASRARVTLIATDLAGATGQAAVQLMIAAAPVVSGQVTFPRRGHLQIAVDARAGAFSSGIRRLILTVHSRLVHLPAGTALRRLLSVRGAHGAKLRLTARRRGDSVIVSLRSPVPSVALRLAATVAPARGGLLATAAGGRRPVALVTVAVG